MNDLLTALANRRSVPPLALGDGVPPDLEALLTLALRVPDHGKLAPWRLIGIRPAARDRLARVLAERGAALGYDEATIAKAVSTWQAAPLIIAVVSCPVAVPKVPEWEQFLSAGALCMNILTHVHAAGYGASWLTGWKAEDQAWLAALGLRAGERLAGCIHIGSVRGEQPERPRPSLADKLSWAE